MEFEEYYEKSRKQIDLHLKRILHETEGDKDIRSMLHYGIKGGKRFRPTLCLLMSDIYGGSKKEALDNAAIVELIHNSSLLHDDVIDHDQIRRGMPSVWKAVSKIPWVGPPELDPRNVAVLIGDDMWSIALNLISDTDMLNASTKTVRALAEGAVLEGKSLIKTKLFGTDVEDYLKVIKLKTASMYALSTHLGAMAAETTLKEEEIARKSGMMIGTCYQLADDIAEKDVPSGVDGRELLLEYGNKFDTVCEELPDNKFTDLYREILPYMVNAQLKQEKRKARLERTEDDFAWVK